MKYPICFPTYKNRNYHKNCIFNNIDIIAKDRKIYFFTDEEDYYKSGYDKYSFGENVYFVIVKSAFKGIRDKRIYIQDYMKGQTYFMLDDDVDCINGAVNYGSPGNNDKRKANLEEVLEYWETAHDNLGCAVSTTDCDIACRWCFDGKSYAAAEPLMWCWFLIDKKCDVMFKERDDWHEDWIFSIDCINAGLDTRRFRFLHLKPIEKDAGRHTLASTDAEVLQKRTIESFLYAQGKITLRWNKKHEKVTPMMRENKNFFIQKEYIDYMGKADYGVFLNEDFCNGNISTSNIDKFIEE